MNVKRLLEDSSFTSRKFILSYLICCLLND